MVLKKGCFYGTNVESVAEKVYLAAPSSTATLLRTLFLLPVRLFNVTFEQRGG